MKINSTSNFMAINSYKNVNKTVAKTNEVSIKDSCEISNLGKTLNTMAATDLKEAPTERIEKIKAQIKEGTYKVDSKLVAEKIIEHLNGREYY
ncbi:flagellar biosynthesis anti-sigma factor FlgM [Clostridium senegalense]|uniref:flagellar biosynthesis anti-sigma factor FlgM n=1 Tax=Clostridium senegalense TaxID=1465809 RepID=UPI0002886E74|nr:flagellar biosynthesis anti-sigma factor FlgM [Clostridium senegalense]